MPTVLQNRKELLERGIIINDERKIISGFCRTASPFRIKHGKDRYPVLVIELDVRELVEDPIVSKADEKSRGSASCIRCS